MIKLKPLAEGPYVQKPQGYQKSNDQFTTIPTGIDKETGKKSWDVMYTGDPKTNKRIMFSKTYEAIKKLAAEFDEVSNLPTYANDQEMKTFTSVLKRLEKEFKAYIIKKGKSGFQQ